MHCKQDILEFILWFLPGCFLDTAFYYLGDYDSSCLLPLVSAASVGSGSCCRNRLSPLPAARLRVNQ